MAWPLAVGMLSYTLMGVVDTLLMGQVSTAAQAGVGLAATLAFGALAFFRGVTTGAQSLVAAADGAGDRTRVRRAGGAGIVLGLVSGAGAMLLLFALTTPVLAWLNNDSAGIGHSARAYLDVRVFSLPCSLLGFGLLAALQGLGETRTRMWVSLTGNVLNALLDLLLIFGWGPIPALGEAGAAYATLVSSALMAALYGARYVRLLGWPRLPTREVLRGAVTIGLPAGMQSFLGVTAFTTMSLALARAGAEHLAASEIVLNIASISFLPGFGVSEAGGVLVGRYLGARRPRTAARTIRSARFLAVALMSSCGVLFVLGNHVVPGWFTRDPDVVRLAGELMLFAAAFQVFDAVAMAHLCALRAAGDTRFALVVTTVSAWGVTVPAAMGLGVGLGWGAPGAWLGLTVEIALLAGVTGWRVAGVRAGRVGRLDLLLGESE